MKWCSKNHKRAGELFSDVDHSFSRYWWVLCSSLSEKQDQLLFSTTRFMSSLVLFRHLHMFSLSSLPVSVELHQEANHYSTAFSLHGWCIHELSNRNHSFSMQVRVGHRCAATTISEKLDSLLLLLVPFCFTDISSQLPVFSVELYQKMSLPFVHTWILHSFPCR